MHAKAGTPDGVLSHTVSSEAWHNLWFNGVLVGETGINAAMCGHWGCPVLLVTGDTSTCAEAKALLGEGLTTVAVKQGLGRFSARQIPPVRARQMIEAGARDALSNLKAVKPYDPGKPSEIVVEVVSPDKLDRYRHRPGCEVLEPRKLASRSGDWWSAWSQFWF
jgi:D-amino peptidase